MSFYVTLPSDSSLQFFPENKISHFKIQLPSPVCLNGEWEEGFSEIIYPHSWLNVNETNNYFLYKAGDDNISLTVKRTIDVGCYETIFYVYSDLISPQIVGDTQAPLLRIVRTKGKDGETISQYYDRPQYLPLVRHSFQTIQSELRLNSGDFVPFERGQIGSGLTHYKGINFQKVYGIGGIFRRLFRAALPFLVKGGKTIGKEVLMTGSRVASDVFSGENLKKL
ncbi:uncharacterized protein TNCV_242331 [Trichonephila clavipes]|uniref:Uncharacterized protein n=1 Tax=Trichonephila clavipes TaxID=2585209 RepID=A0A8X7BES0_TRICX|nr:uncharacterized protein TNCV_242331 [Trichonephila clavipes]